ncbi:MAG: hypothetical protein H6Q59_1129 [Firmicutes bacterium]|nr:hypothetical protein [Bacillota bacterium]
MRMGIPVASVLILIFILWLHYEMKKNSKISKDTLELFWQKERDSNQTRRKDISQLNFLSFTLESLPMEDCEDDTINSYRDTIRKYAARKMVNLSGQTNTDLKLEYGVANFNLLSEYDTNYIAFVSMLQKWAQRLYDHGHLKESQAVLEFSIFQCSTDVTQAYQLLAGLYHKQELPLKTATLIERIRQTQIREKERLIEELEAYTLSNKM